MFGCLKSAQVTRVQLCCLECAGRLSVTLLAAYIRGRGLGTWHLVTGVAAAAAAVLCCCCRCCAAPKAVCDAVVMLSPHRIVIDQWLLYGQDSDSGSPRGCRQRSARDAHFSARCETYCLTGCGTQHLYTCSKGGWRPSRSWIARQC